MCIVHAPPARTCTVAICRRVRMLCVQRRPAAPGPLRVQRHESEVAGPMLGPLAPQGATQRPCHVWCLCLLLMAAGLSVAGGTEPSYRLKSEEQFVQLMVRYRIAASPRSKRKFADTSRVPLFTGGRRGWHADGGLREGGCDRQAGRIRCGAAASSCPYVCACLTHKVRVQASTTSFAGSTSQA